MIDGLNISGDVILFSAIVYGLSDLIMDWSKFKYADLLYSLCLIMGFSECAEPIGLWLLVTYATISLFRFLHFLSQIQSELSEFQPLRSFRRYKLLKLISFLNVFIMYPFLFIWTILGNVWFTQIKIFTPYCVIVIFIFMS